MPLISYNTIVSLLFANLEFCFSVAVAVPAFVYFSVGVYLYVSMALCVLLLLFGLGAGMYSTHLKEYFKPYYTPIAEVSLSYSLLPIFTPQYTW